VGEKMGYTALYRKWRPQRFADLVGQQHVARTLQNAIKMERISHAYLFAGPRGTGKTSTAKIFAKALNCVNPENYEPCNQCEVCQRITGGVSVDVFEIDAASNRGIDEIRDLRENVKFSPIEGSYKVYIIDEVHMLTMEAFNALLKTLEEPPDHVIFILATTEPHKLPQTILSRCQRFDFKKISVTDMVERLQYVCREEGIALSFEAAVKIAANAAGGMRDALSILDQCISYAGEEVGIAEVDFLLGTVAEEVLYQTLEAVASGDGKSVFCIIDEVLRSGKDLGQFLGDLTLYYRNLLLFKEGGESTELIEVGEKTEENLKKLAPRYSREDIIWGIETLAECEGKLKWTTQPRIVVEAALIKLCRGEEVVSLQQVNQRLREFAERIERLGSPVPVAAPIEGPKQVSDRQKVGISAEGGLFSHDDLGQEKEVEPNASPKNCSLDRVKEIWKQAASNFRGEITGVFMQQAEIKEVAGNKMILTAKNIIAVEKINSEAKKIAAVLKGLGFDGLIECRLCKEEEKKKGEKKEERKIKEEEDSFFKMSARFFGVEDIEG
jgi:DNA polymerase-3 subunit gamma/tau